MKSFIRAITIIIVLALIPAVSATAQIAPATAPTAPGSAPEAPAVPATAPAPPTSLQQVIYEVDKTLDSRLSDLNEKLIQLNIATTGQHGGGKVLVIPTAEIKPQDMVTLMEDMAVMCRIFDKKLAQSNLVPGMPFIGRVTFPSLGDHSMGAMYVQGYGALFMTKVYFPLSPPPQTEEQEETEEEDADPVWEQMKQEIFSPQVVARQTPGHQEEKYDARKVKNLKSTLIKALVHTANIRGLKSNESVILTVTGKAILGISGMRGLGLYRGNEDPKIIFTENFTHSLRTVLVIRAKKSYIDALAQNKIDFDQFREKIQLLSYPCLGENLRRGLPPSSTSVDIYGGSSSDRRRSRSGGSGRR